MGLKDELRNHRQIVLNNLPALIHCVPYSWPLLPWIAEYSQCDDKMCRHRAISLRQINNALDECPDSFKVTLIHGLARGRGISRRPVEVFEVVR
jgi:hypothetical protein